MQTHTHTPSQFAPRISRAPICTEIESDTSLAELFDSDQPDQHVQPGRTILLHGTPADRVYQVVSGTIRCCTFTEDGHRQIFRFARKGEFLGFADVNEWHYTAEAVDHVILRSMPREFVESVLERDAGLQRSLRAHMAQELETRENQLVMLAYLTSEQRLTRFLKGFPARHQASSFSVIPMTRQDIGDHLGLTLETVSRAFGALKRKGIIEMNGSEKFRLIDDNQTQLAA